MQLHPPFLSLPKRKMSEIPVILVESMSQTTMNHRGLFFGFEGKPGTQFHVIGMLINMTFEKKTDFIYTEFPEYIRSFHIGSMEEDKLSQVEEICLQIAPPRSPLRLPPGLSRRPSCQNWLGNLLISLKEKGIVNFLDSSFIPDAAVNLQIEG